MGTTRCERSPPAWQAGDEWVREHDYVTEDMAVERETGDSIGRRPSLPKACSRTH